MRRWRRWRGGDDELETVYGHFECESPLEAEAVRSISKIDDDGRVVVVFSCECTPGQHVVEMFEFDPGAVVEITGGPVPLPWSNPLPVMYLDEDEVEALLKWRHDLSEVCDLDDLLRA